MVDFYGIYIPRAPMTSIFEGTQPLKTRPKLQSKQGAPFGFQVYINVGKYTTVLSIRGDLWVEKSHEKCTKDRASLNSSTCSFRTGKS